VCSPREYPDEKTAEELNQKYGDEPLEEEDLELDRRRFVGLRLVAVAVALVFLLISLGGLVQLFNLPVLEFLSQSRQLRSDPLVQELRDSVVNIRVVPQDAGGALRRTRGGTGFNVSPDGLIITNRHVVQDARAVIISFPGHGVFQVTEWTEHSEVDLAAAKIDGEDLPAVSLSSKEPPNSGEEVFVIGNPLGFSRIAARGKIEGYRYFNSERNERTMEVAAPIHPGSSGSPVFDSQGDVVGVVFATFMESEGDESRGLCVPLDRLRAFVYALE